MVKKSVIWAVVFYGLFIAVAGYAGYHFGQSTISFWMGGGMGALLLFSAFFLALGKKKALYAALFFTFLLTGVFTYRYLQTHLAIPATLTVVSAGMFLFLLVHATKWKT